MYQSRTTPLVLEVSFQKKETFLLLCIFPKNPLHSSTRMLDISLPRAVESPSHKHPFHVGSEFLFLTSHNPPSHNHHSHHAQNFSSFWTQLSFPSIYMLNLSLSPFHVSFSFFHSSYLSWVECYHFTALQPSFKDILQSFPSPAESYIPKCAKILSKVWSQVSKKKGVDFPSSWTLPWGTSCCRELNRIPNLWETKKN